jgi:hypothetical protein
VDLPTVLLRDLLQLSSSVGLDADACTAPLVSLVEGLQSAVPSYRGLRLTMVDNGHPVSLTAFVPLEDGDSIKTSLRVGFAALGHGFDDESHVVFYAATPGAFVDLAADFGYALDTPTIAAGTRAKSVDDTDGASQHGLGRSGRYRLIVVDADLPPLTTESRLVGLHERSVMDRAIGIMIEQGHNPDLAHATLRRHAAAAGIEPHIYAAQLLRD